MKRAAIAGAAAIVAIVAIWIWRGRGDDGMRAPDAANAKAQAAAAARARMPTAPPRQGAPPSVAAYDRAIDDNDPHPGATSFRADSDYYVEYNHDLAAKQAADEGLTLDEVRELTYFGFVAMRTSQGSTVEAVLGRKLSDDEARALDQMVEATNQQFKGDMRALVASGAPDDARWKLIHDTEARYQAWFHDHLGMSDDDFDAMLAPTAGENGAVDQRVPLNAPAPR